MFAKRERQRRLFSPVSLLTRVQQAGRVEFGRDTPRECFGGVWLMEILESAQSDPIKQMFLVLTWRARVPDGTRKFVDGRGARRLATSRKKGPNLAVGAFASFIAQRRKATEDQNFLS